MRLTEIYTLVLPSPPEVYTGKVRPFIGVFFSPLIPDSYPLFKNFKMSLVLHKHPNPLMVEFLLHVKKYNSTTYTEAF
jgi:hypothetical protein